MVICLERGADFHMAQLMPLPLTVSCFSKIQIGFTFLVPAHPGSPGQRAVKRVCVTCGRISVLLWQLCCVLPVLWMTSCFRIITKESVPIQLAQCWFPGLAVIGGKI